MHVSCQIKMFRFNNMLLHRLGYMQLFSHFISKKVPIFGH